MSKHVPGWAKIVVAVLFVILAYVCLWGDFSLLGNDIGLQEHPWLPWTLAAVVLLAYLPTSIVVATRSEEPDGPRELSGYLLRDSGLLLWCSLLYGILARGIGEMGLAQVCPWCPWALATALLVLFGALEWRVIHRSDDVTARRLLRGIGIVGVIATCILGLVSIVGLFVGTTGVNDTAVPLLSSRGILGGFSHLAAALMATWLVGEMLAWRNAHPKRDEDG